MTNLPLAKVMVYGTLKRGFRNYHYAKPFCTYSEPVRFWGRLYDSPYDCPAAMFPGRLLTGSFDYAGDLLRFEELEQDFFDRQIESSDGPDCAEPEKRLAELKHVQDGSVRYIEHGRRETAEAGFMRKPSGEWTLLEGELFTLNNADSALMVFDELESAFVDDVLRYDRVAVPVITLEGVVRPAWAYEIYTVPEGSTLCPGSSWKG